MWPSPRRRFAEAARRAPISIGRQERRACSHGRSAFPPNARRIGRPIAWRVRPATCAGACLTPSLRRTIRRSIRQAYRSSRLTRPPTLRRRPSFPRPDPATLRRPRRDRSAYRICREARDQRARKIIAFHNANPWLLWRAIYARAPVAASASAASFSSSLTAAALTSSLPRRAVSDEGRS